MWKSLAAESVTGYGAVVRWLWITFLTVLILQPVISITLDTKNSTCMVSSLQKMLT